MGLAAGGWFLHPFGFSRKPFQCGEAAGWPEPGRPQFYTQTEERGGERSGLRGRPWAVTPLGSRAGPWRDCGVGEACHQDLAPASSFHTLPLIPWHSPPSFPPLASKCQHIPCVCSFPLPFLPRFPNKQISHSGQVCISDLYILPEYECMSFSKGHRYC